MKKIALFGVTGNPPHLGHLRAAKEALESCDEVWVSLVFVHPFNKSFIDYEHRLNMMNMMFAGIHNIKIVELDKEFYEKNKEMPYSYHLLNYMKETSKEEISPILVIGEDNQKVWHKFLFNDRIESEYGLLVVKDSGVHSTQIRSFCIEGDWNKVKQSCGEQIADYLKENLIYSVEV